MAFILIATLPQKNYRYLWISDGLQDTLGKYVYNMDIPSVDIILKYTNRWDVYVLGTNIYGGVTPPFISGANISTKYNKIYLGGNGF